MASGGTRFIMNRDSFDSWLGEVPDTTEGGARLAAEIEHFLGVHQRQQLRTPFAPVAAVTPMASEPITSAQ